MINYVFSIVRLSGSSSLIPVSVILSAFCILFFSSISPLTYSVSDTNNISSNANAIRLHNISCSQISRDTDRSNGASNALLEVDNTSYKVNVSLLIISSDDGKDIYKGDCNNPTNLVLRADRSIKLHFNNNIGDGASVFLANNSKSDKSILLGLRGQEFKEMTSMNNRNNTAKTPNISGIKDLELNVSAKKQGTYRLIINEFQNSETTSLMIINNVRVL
jgi:hypothetical protein